jgi:hypothetical protein
MGDDQAAMYGGGSGGGGGSGSGSYYYSSADDSYGDDETLWHIAQVQRASAQQAQGRVSPQDEAQLQQAAMAVAGALAQEVGSSGGVRSPEEKLSLLQRAVTLIAEAVEEVMDWAEYQRGSYSDVSADAAMFTSSSGQPAGASSGASGSRAVSSGELHTMADVLLWDDEPDRQVAGGEVRAEKEQQQQQQQQGGSGLPEEYNYYYDLLPGELAQANPDYPTDIFAMEANVAQLQQQGRSGPCDHQQGLGAQAALQQEIDEEVSVALQSLGKPVTATTPSGSTITTSTGGAAADFPATTYRGSTGAYYDDEDQVRAAGARRPTAAPARRSRACPARHPSGAPHTATRLPLHGSCSASHCKRQLQRQPPACLSTRPHPSSASAAQGSCAALSWRLSAPRRRRR